MTANRLDTLEERIEKPGYLLFLVLVLLLLIVGLVDLIDYVGEEPVIFGLYSIRYFLLLVAYTIFTLFWASLLFRPNDDRLFRRVLDALQKRPWLAIVALALILAANVVLIRASVTIEGAVVTLPAFQIVVLVLSLLAAGLILFYKWDAGDRPQRWRKVILAIVGVVVAIELVMQLLAFLGVLRTDLTTTRSIDYYSPYNRVYQTEEGFANGITNNYGRYAPEFELLPDSYRIAVVGDSFVEGLQVAKEEQFGHLMEQRLVANGTGEASEVLQVGYPDLGPGIYLSTWMTEVMNQELSPNEAIVFFDLGNDFQTVDEAGLGYPYYYFDEDGSLVLELKYEYRDFHEAEHYVYRGYKGFQPVLILKTNFLTARLLGNAFDNLLGRDEVPMPAYDGRTNFQIPRPIEAVFNEESGADALEIAAAQVGMARDLFAKDGVAVKWVTNPAFTPAFFEQDTWNAMLGQSDLLLPERRLQEAAEQAGVPFLGLGAYMAAQGLAPSDVQALYFKDGLGHLTPAGHAFVAEAIYECFYAQTVPVEAGCVLP